jgi:hypothetical protein
MDIPVHGFFAHHPGKPDIKDGSDKTGEGDNE